MPVAPAWLLRRAPDVLLIPGASSLPRLREDVAGAAVPLSDGDIAELDQVGHPLR